MNILDRWWCFEARKASGFTDFKVHSHQLFFSLSYQFSSNVRSFITIFVLSSVLSHGLSLKCLHEASPCLGFDIYTFSNRDSCSWNKKLENSKSTLESQHSDDFCFSYEFTEEQAEHIDSHGFERESWWWGCLYNLSVTPWLRTITSAQTQTSLFLNCTQHVVRLS